jgi:hypothetical protein
MVELLFYSAVSPRIAPLLPSAVVHFQSLCYPEAVLKRVLMRLARCFGCFGAIAGWGVLRAQKPFKVYQGTQYENCAPEDWQKPAEWTRARLIYPSFFGSRHPRWLPLAGPSTIPVRTATCSGMPASRASTPARWNKAWNRMATMRL